MTAYEKLELLKTNLNKMGSVAVAFSGGVDSTFLVRVAHEMLGDKALAVTVHSEISPEWEYEDTIKLAHDLGFRHEVIGVNIMNIEGLANNPKNRCYLCKREVFGNILLLAKEKGLNYVVDGSNVDDLGDYRPGMAALKELGVVSPLRDAGMTKEDIRFLSREFGLPTWNKPPFACLASRFPYGERITPEKLKMVDKAEQFLQNLGFRQVRVRHHGDIARIEVDAAERNKFFSEEIMNKVDDELKHLGFTYVALDLRGYRTGSLNVNVQRV